MKYRDFILYRCGDEYMPDEEEYIEQLFDDFDEIIGNDQYYIPTKQAAIIIRL